MFKKIRFTFEYYFYYLKKNILYIFLGLFIGIFSFIKKDLLIKIYQQFQTQQTVVGIEGLFRPSNLPPSIAKIISLGLIETTENYRVVNSPLIKSLDIQNNNLEYHFVLNPNFVWQNGKKINSKDLQLPFPESNISYPDSSKFVIKLSSPFSPTLSLLTKPLFIKNTLIGIGNYKVSSSTLLEGYLKTLHLINTNTNEQLTYKFYQSEKDLTNAFKLGEVDQISLSQIPPEFNSWPNITINKKIETDQYVAVFLNTEKISQKSIRQALSYATPKTSDKNQRCFGPISPNSWAYNQIVKEYNFNPTRSQELFDIKSLPSIKLLVSDRKLITTAEGIQDAWEKILKVQTEISVLSQTSDLNNFDAVLAFGQIPNDPDQFTYWHSTQTQTNITKLNNPRIDKLLEEGRNSFDLIERKQIYQDFQKYLLEESPAVFLEFPTTYTITRVK